MFAAQQNMAVNNLFDDLDVVPCVSLNAKKAKKKLKKIVRNRDDDAALSLLPVDRTCEPAPCAPAPAPVQAAAPKAKKVDLRATKKPIKTALASPAAIKPWQRPSFADDASTSAGSSSDADASSETGESTRTGDSTPTTPPAPASLMSLLAKKDSSAPRKSWYEITEEDDDDFLL